LTLKNTKNHIKNLCSALGRLGREFNTRNLNKVEMPIEFSLKKTALRLIKSIIQYLGISN
ncbi:MAG: hypothetical protein J6A46_03355, partial [Clostridia bacterium]|nr:hypothetical protein [Clostridia bacterium]